MPRKSSLALAIALSAVTGCVLPERDNPLDPHLAPAVVLSASAEDASGEPTTSNEGSRNTRFTLDAGASTDRDGRPLTDFRWDLDGDGEFELLDGGPLLTHVAFTVTSADLPGGVGGLQRTVRVEGRSHEGRAVAEATVVLRNSAPHVELGEEMYAAPYRGYTVVLDPCAGGVECLSGDADGDALAWTWTQTGGPAVALTPSADGTASFTAPLEPSLLVFQADATDGLASDSDRVTVRIEPSIWLQTVNPSRTMRFDAGAAIDVIWSFDGDASAFAGTSGASLDVDESTGDVWIGLNTGGNATLVRRGTTITGAPDDTWSIDTGSYDAYETMAAGAGSACTRGYNAGTLFRLDPGAPAIEVTLPSGAPRFLLGDTASGDCLAMTATGVYRIATGGAVTDLQVSPPLDDPKFAHLAPDGSLWILEKAGASTGQTFFASHRVVRVTPDGARTLVLESSDHMFDLLRDHPDGGFWIHAVGSENAVYRLFPDGTLAATNAPEVPPAGPHGAFSDVRTRSFYVYDFTGRRMVRMADREGLVESVDSVSLEDLGFDFSVYFQPLAFDRGRGRMYFFDQRIDVPGDGSVHAETRVVAVPASFALRGEIPVGGRKAPAVDGTRGAAWTTADLSDSFKLERWTPTARVLATVFTKTHARAFSAEPDGSLWTVEIHRTTESPPAGSDGVRRYGVDGSMQNEFLVANGSNAKLDAYDGGACGSIERSSASGFGGDGLTRLFRVTPSSGVLELDAVSDPACVISAAASPNGDCWFLVQDDCAVDGVSSLHYEPVTGSPVVTSTDLGGQLRADPRGDGVWSVHTPAASNTVRVRHLTAAGATVEDWSRVEDVFVSFDSFAVTPRCGGSGPECVEIWYAGGDAGGPTVRRANAVTGTSLQSFSLPGTIENMGGSR